MTMEDRVLEYMEKHGSITTLEAIQHLGCTRLSEYIRRIRLHTPVFSEWKKAKNRWGEKTRVKVYALKNAPQADQDK